MWACVVVQIEYNATAHTPKQLETTMSEDTVSILEFSEDIGSAEAPPVLPANEYPATIEKVDVRESSSGNMMIPVTFRISADDFPADFDGAESYPDGVTITYYRLLAEDNQRARYNLRKFCETIGAKMGKTVDPNEWIGLSATLKVQPEMYEGEPRLSIKAVGSA